MPRHRILLPTAVLLATAAPAATAFAQTQPEDRTRAEPRRERVFARLDGDGDGFVTRAELDAGIKKVVERREARQKPLEAGAGDRAERMMARLDRDGDGRLSRDEFLALRPARDDRPRG